MSLPDAIAPGIYATCRHAGRWRKLIARMFLGDLTGEQQNDLLDHVRHCSSCRRHYHRHLTVERTLVQERDQPTHFERERLAQRIFAEARLRDREMELKQKVQPWRRRAWIWSASMAVLLLVGAGVLWRQLRTPPAKELTPKGIATTTRPMVGLRVLRLFEQEQDGQRALAAPLPPVRPGKLRRLRLGDSMVLLYTNRGARRFAFVVGVGPDWEPRWYFPSPPEARSVPLSPGVVDRPFGDPVRLRVNHTKGRLTIFGLFSDRPLTMKQVSLALERAEGHGRPPWQHGRLQLPGNVQQVRLHYLLEPDP
jgi:hypothetical protein